MTWKTLTPGEKIVGSLIWLAILSVGAWWYFGDAAPNAAPDAPIKAETKPAPPAPSLSAEERYNRMLPDPVRSRRIREATDRKTLVLFLQDIEKASANAIRNIDAKELAIQRDYAFAAMIRMAQIPNAAGDKDIECVAAAIDLYQLIKDVTDAYSPARAETDYEENTERWRKAIRTCERAVGLKPGSRSF